MDRSKARIHTKHGVVIKEVNVHSHNPCAAEVEAANVTTKIKVCEATTIENPSVIINEVIVNISQGTQVSLAGIVVMKKIIRQKRKETNAAPPNPSNLTELTLPSEFQAISNTDGGDKEFLLSDSGPGKEKILTFGCKSWLLHLVAYGNLVL